MRLALVLVATAACACGRIDFDARPDAAGDAPDADALLPRTCDWSAGPPFPGPALRRADLSSLVNEVDPFLAPGDPLRMYLGSERAGDLDLYVATRPALDQPFTQVTRLSELNTIGEVETGLVLDATQTTGFYTSAREIHAAVRDVPGGPLRDAGTVAELAIDTVFQDAWPSPDGLRLTFSAFTNPSLIYTADRASTTQPWNPPVVSSLNVAGLSSAGATLTADELVVVWSSEDGGGDIDIYYAVRTDRSQPFPARQQLVAASSIETDFEPSIREDGCELFFGRAISANNFDIFSLVADPP